LAITVAQKGNPIRVTGTTDTSNEIHNGREAIYVGKVYWFAPSTAGHLLTLQTSKGIYIAELRCDADNVSVELDVCAYFDDIYCTDMDSGTLYIYTR